MQQTQFCNWNKKPSTVNTVSTGRKNGVSSPPFESLNLGSHVNDEPASVLHNRQLVAQRYNFPSSPLWLEQTHSNIVINSDDYHSGINADAIVTTKKNTVCAILTADCLPIFICNKQGSEVAAIHAGWRSMAKGIIDNTFTQLKSSPIDCMAWLGPCISAQHYIVASDMVEQFITNSAAFTHCFTPYNDKWLANLQAIASVYLRKNGLTEIHSSSSCTFQQTNDFFSYRRDGTTGRMASFIWIS